MPGPIAELGNRVIGAARRLRDRLASPAVTAVDDAGEEGAREGEGIHLRPYAFEVAAWAGLIATVLFLRSRGLRIDWRTFDYTIPPLIPVMAKSCLMGIGLYSLYAWIRERSPLGYWRRVLTPSWLLLTARLWLAILVFTYSYVWLKVCVPLVNQQLWDRAFWQLDTTMHLGFSPSLFMVELFSGSGLGSWIDLWYIAWLPSVSFSIAFFVAFPSSAVRRQFLLSCVLIWTLGAWIYTGLPALGPVYVYNDTWSELIQEMPRADGAQHLLWENYERVLAGRDGELKRFNPTRGIAAMPSLHVGVHWLLMLWIRRHIRPLYALAVLAVFLTFLGSVVTGWHYAIDGYVGILLAQISYWIALAIERRQGRRLIPGEAVA